MGDRVGDRAQDWLRVFCIITSNVVVSGGKRTAKSKPSLFSVSSFGDPLRASVMCISISIPVPKTYSNIGAKPQFCLVHSLRVPPSYHIHFEVYPYAVTSRCIPLHFEVLIRYQNTPTLEQKKRCLVAVCHSLSAVARRGARNGASREARA